MIETTIRFERTYWEGGHKYCDWHTFKIATVRGPDHVWETRYSIIYYANMGTMKADMTEASFRSQLAEWLKKTEFKMITTAKVNT